MPGVRRGSFRWRKRHAQRSQIIPLADSAKTKCRSKFPLSFAPSKCARFPEIPVENPSLARLDGNGQADISVLLRSSNDHVRSNRQRHNLGNCIVREMLACDIFKELSVGRVDGEKVLRKIPRVP